MPFKYNPPTRDFCHVCEQIAKNKIVPIIDTFNGKASSANNFPFHNWYNFVLGYTPEFPDYLIKKFKISEKDFVVDPFMGTGTTLICCKQNNISSAGLDANDFFIDVARTKLEWDLNPQELIHYKDILIKEFNSVIENIDFENNNGEGTLFSSNGKESYRSFITQYRPTLLDQRYISDKPLVKLGILKDLIKKNTPESLSPFFLLGLSAIVVPVSNIKYGPGFGVNKPKEDPNVVKVYKEKIERMINDIRSYKNNHYAPSSVYLGDARIIDSFFKGNSIDYMVTSPPYPGDHEYTKHTKLELILMNYVSSTDDIKTIKKRMLRGSTTNIYKDDNDRKDILDIMSIKKITDLIDQRLIDDGATSGFEKLYTKLVWEYFGGMYKTFESSYKVLKYGGKFSLLVSDSHAFKMTHIKTAEILGEIAVKAGFSTVDIELWQNKISSSHKYFIQENILTLTK